MKMGLWMSRVGEGDKEDKVPMMICGVEEGVAGRETSLG